MLAFQVSIIATILGFGLRSTLDDVLYLVRRPGLLLRSLLAMFVIIPVIAMALARAFDFSFVAKVALLCLAISPLPPFLPMKMLKAGGKESFAYSLLIIVSLLSVVIVPLGVEVFERYYGRPIAMSGAAVAGIVFLFVLLPYAVGMGVNYLAPGLAERLERAVSLLGKVLLPLAAIPILIANFPAVWALVGNGTVLALAVFAVAALLVGHLMGEPDPEESSVLAIASSTRHPGIAIAIAAANFHDAAFAPVVILYLIVSALVTVPYMMWLKSSALHGHPTGSHL
jgi:BASS family bile acid:Na+ symporter